MQCGALDGILEQKKDIGEKISEIQVKPEVDWMVQNHHWLLRLRTVLWLYEIFTLGEAGWSVYSNSPYSCWNFSINVKTFQNKKFPPPKSHQEQIPITESVAQPNKQTTCHFDHTSNFFSFYAVSQFDGIWKKEFLDLEPEDLGFGSDCFTCYLPGLEQCITLLQSYPLNEMVIMIPPWWDCCDDGMGTTVRAQ